MVIKISIFQGFNRKSLQIRVNSKLKIATFSFCRYSKQPLKLQMRTNTLTNRSCQIDQCQYIFNIPFILMRNLQYSVHEILQ